MASVSLLSNSESLHLLTECNNSFDDNAVCYQKSRKTIQPENLEVIESEKSVKVHTDRPHLVSLGGGRLSTAVTLFPINEGRTYVGTVDAPTPQDVIIQGTGVEAEHCIIENVNGIVTLHPIAEKTAIDGLQISKTTRLTQGSMVCLGRSTYFRFNHPQEAQLMKSILPNSRISVFPINFNAEQSHILARSVPSPLTPTSPSSVNSDPCTSRTPLSNPESVSDPRMTSGHGLRDDKQKISHYDFPPPTHNRSNSATADPQRWLLHDNQSSAHFHHVKPQRKASLPHLATTSEPLSNSAKSTTMSSAPALPKLVSITKLDPQISPKVFIPTARNGEKQVHLHGQGATTPSHQSRGSLGSHCSYEDLQVCQQQLEQQHQKVVEERIREQELEKQEQIRLEEILNICAEYERQTQREKTTFPRDTNSSNVESHSPPPLESTDKKSDCEPRPTSPIPSPTLALGGLHVNRIITNGSLPRDTVRSPQGPDVSSVYQRKPTKSTSSEDELTRIFNIDSSPSAPLSPSDSSGSSASKLNVNYSTYPQSPRTRIKTVVNKEKAAAAAAQHQEVYENRSALETNELQSAGCSYPVRTRDEIDGAVHEPISTVRVIANRGAIELADEVFYPERKACKVNFGFKMSTALIQEEAALLRQQKNAIIRRITAMRHQTLDLDTQEDDVVSELEMECALVDGELQALLEKHRCDQEALAALNQRECDLLQEAEFARGKEHANIERARLRLDQMEQALKSLECNLDVQPEGTPEREDLLQQIKHQHEIVETERKLFEDLEFQQLEHDSHREEERERVIFERITLAEQLEKRQFEIKEIEAQKEQISSQINHERQALLAERQRLFSMLKVDKDNLATIDTKLKALIALDMSTDRDSDEESSQSSVEGEVEITTNTTPTERLQHLINKRGGHVFEDELVTVGNTNSYGSFESGTSSGTGSDIPAESLSSEEYSDKVLSDRYGIVGDLDELQITGDGRDARQVAASWQKMRQVNAERDGFLEETAPLCGSMYANGVKHRERCAATYHQQQQQRPLTRYLPVRGDDFNLKQHVESAGHQIELCSHIHVSRTTCRGYLEKLGSKFRTWNKRWFVFDRVKRMLLYYTDKSEMRLRGRIYFQHIIEVYVDHLHSVKSPNSKLTFCVKTVDRVYHLVAPSAEAMRMWVDVIFTGAEGYQEFPAINE